MIGALLWALQMLQSTGLVRLTKYLLNTMGYDHCMEIYSDSDWSGNKVTSDDFAQLGGGRLLWLQQAVREGQLTVSAIASAYNLGDLSTKMHSAIRLKVKRVRQGWARELGSSECFTGDMNRLAKRVAMLTIMMMPTLAEAADDGTQQAPNYSLYFVTVLCMLFAVYRALSHFQYGYGPLSGDAATLEAQCFRK